MARLRVLLLLLVIFVPAVFAQEQAESTPTPVEPFVCPEGFEGQTLNVFNWSTYIAENTVPDFEAACGVTIVYDIYDSNEQLLTRIRTGNPGYDIIFPGPNGIAQLINEELLIPLDKEAIPNMANIYPEMLAREYDPEADYSVPYLISTVGIGYNTEQFPDGLTSWEQFWQHDGPIAWLDDRRAVMGVALNILGFDPNTENADEIAAARDYLIANGANVISIAADDGQLQLERGDVDATIEYSGDIFQLQYDCECDTFAYTIPVEGTYYEMDGIAVPVGAQNPELAMVFVNYLLHPQVAADIANYTAYGSPNQVAIENLLIDAELLANPGIYPSEEARSHLFSITEVSADAEQLYNDAWDEILITLGQ